MALNQIHVSAESAIFMDETSGRVLFGKDIHKKMSIASITKVMTAIIAIESGKLNQMVTISENSHGTEGSSLYLKKGEKIKLRDLVYGLLMRSGNDAAVAIAEKVSGSATGFVYQMNKKAKELGMLDTTFTNPHGLDDAHHRSTAYDMALLTQYAMQNKTFQSMFKTKFYTSPQGGESWDRHWKNKNKLLFNYDYATGGKTGYTKKTGRTLISTATKDNKDFIVVTLSDGDDWNDHRNLFDWGFAHFNMVKVMHKGKLNGIKKTYNKRAVFLHRDITLPLTFKEKADLSTRLTLYKPKEGTQFHKLPQIAGKLQVIVQGKMLESVPVYYTPAEKDPKKFWSLVQVIIGNMLELNDD